MRRHQGGLNDFAGALVAIAAVAACAGALAWAAPIALHPTISAASGNDAVTTADVVSPSGVERTMVALGALDRKDPDTLAAVSLTRVMCDALPTDPVMSQSLVLGSTHTQAIVMAMPPGAGAWTADALIDAAARCLGKADAKLVSWLPESSIQVTADKTTTLVWSRGDFVVVASGDTDDAKTIDDTLTRALVTNGCLNLTPAAKDYLQNPVVAGTEYRGPTKIETVSVDPIMPTDDDGKELPTPTSSDIPNAGDEVELPTVPDGRVYWPDLPAQVAYPVVVKPLKQPELTAQVAVPIADTQGPGCGWSFFDYEPREAAGATSTEEQALLSDAETALTGSWQAWADSVAEFWANQKRYIKQVAAYDAYRDEVETVSATWSTEAAPLWDQYDKDMDAYSKAKQARDKWQEQYDSASQTWNAFLATCSATAGSQTPPQAGGSVPAPSPSAPSCDSQEPPQILSQTPPEVPAKPAKPTPPETP